jgi:hypothetical protein
MSGKQKALLIVLGVVLIVLFVVAVGANSGKEKGDPGKPNGIVNFLAKFGAKKSAVDPATVTASCTEVSGQPHSYQFTGSCELTVADPGTIKTLILRSTSEFGVTAPAPGGADFTIDDTVEPSPGTGAVAKVAVDKAAHVTVSCPGFNTTCVVTVAAE